MSTCPITGEAEVQADYTIDHPGRVLSWLRADPEIHVAEEVLGGMDEEGRAFLEAHYEVGETCPHMPHTRHARRWARSES